MTTALTTTTAVIALASIVCTSTAAIMAYATTLQIPRIPYAPTFFQRVIGGVVSLFDV